MEELQKRHRQEQKDLQSRITQKKKSATKKTRKSINDECTNLERQLKEKQDLELSALNGSPEPEVASIDHEHDGNVKEDSTVLGEARNSVEDLHTFPNATAPDHPKKPNRQRARLARRAAEREEAIAQAAREASDLPNLREKEREAMQTVYSSLGLQEQEIRSDGHCLYAAVADQLIDSGIGLKPKSDVDIIDTEHESSRPGYKVTRQVAASYILRNPDDFVPFLEDSLDVYIRQIRDTGEWGGHLELLALARAYLVDIKVLQGDGKVETIECGSGSSIKVLWLAYYRHNFGLGEHYNSLRRAARDD